MSDIRGFWKTAVLLAAYMVAYSGVAGAQTWCTPQFIANGLGSRLPPTETGLLLCSSRQRPPD
jgi:hypothetical protein